MISIVIEMEAADQQPSQPSQPELDPISAGNTDRIFTQAISLNRQYAQEKAIRDEQDAAAENAAARETEEINIADQVKKRKTSARIAARVEEEISKDPELPKLQAAQKVFSKLNADKSQQLANIADPTIDQKKLSGDPKSVKE